LLPSFNGGIGGAGDTVFAITVYNGRIYVSGKFTTVFSSARTNIARLNYDGTINSWNPSGVGVVRKSMLWRNKLLVTADAGAFDDRVVKIDTSTAVVNQLMITTNSSAGYAQAIQDFVTRNDSLYAVGSFYEVDGIGFDGFVVCNINSAAKRSWGITIPQYSIYEKNRVHIEYYRDSLYIGTVDAATQSPTYHRVYVVHYRGNVLRTLKIYNSNQAGLNGDFCEDLLIANARMIEVQRFAQHTAFPYGSKYCTIYSWCMKIPNVGSPYTVAPVSICPNDTAWFAVRKEYYYSSYVWSSISSNMTLVPFDDSCMVITNSLFAGGQIRVKGMTSCGVQNAIFQTRNFTALVPPSVSAGPDDTLTCVVTSVMLRGTCTPTPFSWNWSGPNVSSNADSVFVNTPGMFYLECTAINGCKSRDSATVFADTIPPALVTFTGAPLITCTNPAVVLDASALYPNDSLRWIIGASSYANPATTASPGNVLLVVTDRSNGCSSTDTILVSQNIALPTGVAVYGDSVLTCSRDSVLLSATSSNPDVVFHWLDSALNTFANPFFATAAGYFSLLATDTINGCTSSPDGAIIYTWYTPPSVVVATDSFNINCSYDSVWLSGSSLTVSANLLWTDFVSFSSSNPAMTGQQGWYYLVATDSLNGCVAVDSAYVGFEPILDVIGSNDTIICSGSGAVLNVIPIGGTPSFQYLWNNAAGSTALVTVYPNDTLSYIVTVTDGAGCVGEDTVVVNVPDPVMDSVLSFQPCDPLQPTGQIQIYPWGGVPPYQYSNDNGVTWQASNIFGSLTYGSYTFLVQDAIGCTHSTAGNIDTNSLSPAPEFLVSTSPELGDTLVIVDISNPRPDSVTWDFSPGTVIVDTSMFSPVIVPGDTGNFSIDMHAWYGTCEVILTRVVTVEEFDSLSAQSWNANAIDSVILYPNPNSGTFTVHAELQSKQNFGVLVIDELGNERARTCVYDADQWTGSMSVLNPVPGNYILRVIAEYDSSEIIFVISQ
ncbi:MAG TPA: hypothetical protein VK826_02040, partial [Bacteroidia bacterium]|nr:hypothetical protein [Bacteroidia bacterium]